MIGVLAALLEAKVSGQGQTVDAAVVDGTAHLSAMLWSLLGFWAFAEERVSNLLDGGVPFYDLYATSDGRHMAVGALESKFFATFITQLGVAEECPPQGDAVRCPEMRQLFAKTFATRTMAEWTEIFEGTDACVTPVLRPSEAARHPHMTARGALVPRNSRVEPAPASRFSRTAAALSSPPSAVGAPTREALPARGIADADALIRAGVAVQG